MFTSFWGVLGKDRGGRKLNERQWIQSTLVKFTDFNWEGFGSVDGLCCMCLQLNFGCMPAQDLSYLEGFWLDAGISGKDFGCWEGF